MSEQIVGDRIEVCELEVAARIGVPDDERAAPQRLTISMTLWPKKDFRELRDELANTIDYAAVCADVKEFVSRTEHKLIETLVDAVAAHLLAAYPVARVRVEVRKFILPDVKHVGVIVERVRSHGG
jgi:FolB domain-containing protein